MNINIKLESYFKYLRERERGKVRILTSSQA